jgi:hypothetical protein
VVITSSPDEPPCTIHFPSGLHAGRSMPYSRGTATDCSVRLPATVTRETSNFPPITLTFTV